MTRLPLHLVLALRWCSYEWFHRALGENPSSDMLDFLAEPTALAALETLAEPNSHLEGVPNLIREVHAAPASSRALGNMRCEYARFFVGPEKPAAVPWQFARDENGMLFSPAALDLRAFYQAQGFTAIRGPQVSDDHVALQAAFMAKLAERSCAAVKTGDAETLAAATATQAVFLDRYLGAWMPDYAREAQAARTGRLYPEIISGFAEFVALDIEILRELA